MNKSKIIVDYLNAVVPDAKCELNYTKDYELIIAVMLSAQTTDKRVNEVTRVLFEKYQTLEELANASIGDIKSIIKSLGFFNVKAENIFKISKILNQAGHKKYTRKFLESLPGVGRKTTNVVLSELYDKETFAVDTHVLRFSKRMGIANDTDSLIDVEKKLEKFFKGYDINKLNHQIIIYSRYTCTARNPKCDTCKLSNICTYKK